MRMLKNANLGKKFMDLSFYPDPHRKLRDSIQGQDPYSIQVSLNSVE